VQLRFRRRAEKLAAEAIEIVPRQASRASGGPGVDRVEAEPTKTRVDDDLANETDDRPDPTIWGEQLRALAVQAPRAVIMEAWSHVESEIARLGSPYGATASPSVMMRTLVEGEVVPRRVGDVVNGLRSLRNEVAHSVTFDPGEEAALAYLNAAIDAYRVLQSLPGVPPRQK